jgi:hypothetical protein
MIRDPSSVGDVRLELKFASPLDSAKVLVVMGVFMSEVEITDKRELIF